MKVIVLGGGLVGGPMAADLALDTHMEVTLVDRDTARLAELAIRHPRIQTRRADLADAANVATLVADHDRVINAVPGFMGYKTLQTIIEAGKDVVDIAFFEEDPFGLDQRARDKGVTAVVDCGVAPGLSNLLAAHAANQLDHTESILIYVGGLPRVRTWPYEYKAVFSPVDVIAEYTRPARYVENSVEVIRPALSDPELLEFGEMGTLEAFNTDGLRSLAVTLDAPNMKEKTLRYPGHIDKMAVLRETGFFGEDPIEINGVSIRPLDFTSKLLFPMWKLQPGEEDITVMKIVVEGTLDGQPRRHVFDLLDRYDVATQTHSMARTTGYSATVVLRMLAAGLYSEHGISPPELLGRDPRCVEFMLEGLASRGIQVQHTVEDTPQN